MGLKFTGGKELNQPTLLFYFFLWNVVLLILELLLFGFICYEFLACYKSLVSFNILFLSRTLSQGKLLGLWRSLLKIELGLGSHHNSIYY